MIALPYLSLHDLPPPALLPVGMRLAHFILPERPAAGVDGACDDGRLGLAVVHSARGVIAARPELDCFDVIGHRSIPQLARAIAEHQDNRLSFNAFGIGLAAPTETNQ
jgi:hypothetical protein